MPMVPSTSLPARLKQRCTPTDLRSCTGLHPMQRCSTDGSNSSGDESWRSRQALADPALALLFRLHPGDTLVLHNRAVLHARTDYVDWPELPRRRHLKRLWIDAPDLLPVDSVHELGDIFAR